MDEETRLLEMLKSPKASVRYEACELLRVQSSISAQALSALEHALEDPNISVQDSASSALRVHKTKSVEPNGSLGPTVPEEPKSTDIIKFIGMIIIACLSAVASSWLVIIAIVLFSLVYGLFIQNDPTSGESVQALMFCFFVWPIAVVAGLIFMLASFILFNKSYQKHPLLLSTVSGALGGLVPFVYIFINNLSIR
jgi:hypothetical protein